MSMCMVLQVLIISFFTSCSRIKHEHLQDIVLQSLSEASWGYTQAVLDYRHQNMTIQGYQAIVCIHIPFRSSPIGKHARFLQKYRKLTLLIPIKAIEWSMVTLTAIFVLLRVIYRIKVNSFGPSDMVVVFTWASFVLASTCDSVLFAEGYWVSSISFDGPGRLAVFEVIPFDRIETVLKVCESVSHPLLLIPSRRGILSRNFDVPDLKLT